MIVFPEVDPRESTATRTLLRELRSVGIPLKATLTSIDPHYWVPVIEVNINSIAAPMRFLRFRDRIAYMGPGQTLAPIAQFVKQLPERTGFSDGAIICLNTVTAFQQFAELLRQHILPDPQREMAR